MCQDPYAQYYLGICKEKGYGIDINLKEAAELYCDSAKAGIAEARHNLAVFYEYGYGGKNVCYMLFVRC